MLEHGGRLREAAAHYDIPLADWLDLSTGINPEPWPVPPLPASCWQRLPESGDGLIILTNTRSGNVLFEPLVCAWDTWVNGEETNLCKAY